MEGDTEENAALTEAQVERIRKNKERAVQLQKSRLIAHPYAKPDVVTIEKSTIKIGTTRYKDTGGGFLLEVNEGEPAANPVVTVEDPSPIVEPERPKCENCEKTFANSYLFDKFDFKVCDECRDPDVHKLITKTEAQNEYLLKDCDFDMREPPLKFIRKKNPHNNRWGDMKLYLQLQVEKRALEVWGTEEKLQEELEKREEKRVEMKTKKYEKEMNELRMSMRSSLYDRTMGSRRHVHEFSAEHYNEADDTYTRHCTTCPYEETYEKM